MTQERRTPASIALLIVFVCAFCTSSFGRVYRDSQNHFSFKVPVSAKILYRQDLKGIYSDTMLTNQYWKDVLGIVLLGDTDFVSYPFVTVRKEPLEPETRLSFVTFVTGVFWGIQNNKPANPANMDKEIDSVTASVRTDMDLEGGVRGHVFTKYYLGKNKIVSLTSYSELAKSRSALSPFLGLANSFTFDASHRYETTPLPTKKPSAQTGGEGIKSSPDEIELAKGWRRLAVPLLGTIDIPPSLEIQGGFYKEIHDALTAESGDGHKTLILQQHGLNDMKAGAQSKYARVLIDNIEVGEDRIGSLKGHLELSTADLQEVAEAIRQQVASQPGMTILSFSGAKQQTMDGMNAIVLEYRRRLNDNPIVKVWVYLFPNEDYLHRVTVSYRERDEHFWKNDMAQFMARINIEVRKPIEAIKKNDPLSLLFGENWPAVLIVSFLVTWVIGLTPPLLIRYAIRRKPLKKWSAMAISGAFWVLNIGIFTALESKSKTHTALTIVMVVSYFILRAGSKKLKSEGAQ